MPTSKYFALLAAVGCFLGVAVAGGQSEEPSKSTCKEGSPVAKTKNGTVCGTRLPTFSQDAFLGVPFAEPPIGDLRLRHPKSFDTAYTAYDATSQPPSCPGYAGFDVGIGPLNEDCLYLNVIVPDCDDAPGKKLPVLVWYVV